MKIRIFKTKNFARWAKKENISDEDLKNAISEINIGLIDVDLGGCLIKKRIARNGKGKRGGFRVLLAFRSKDRSIFLFGFSKKDRENIDKDEKEVYKKLANIYLNISISNLDEMCVNKLITEVEYEER